MANIANEILRKYLSRLESLMPYFCTNRNVSQAGNIVQIRSRLGRF